MTMLKMRSTNYLEAKMNNKYKIMLVLSLALATTACQDDDYVSTRHPQDGAATVSDSDLAEDTTDALDQDIDDSSTDTLESESPTEDGTGSDSLDSSSDEGDGIIYGVEDIVNVRVAPSETSNILTTVEPGDDILKLGDSDDWSRISIDGQTGYIRTDLLSSN